MIPLRPGRIGLVGGRIDVLAAAGATARVLTATTAAQHGLRQGRELGLETRSLAAADDADTARHTGGRQIVGHRHFHVAARRPRLPGRQREGRLVEVLLARDAVGVLVAAALHHFQPHPALVGDGVGGGGGHQELDAGTARNGLGRVVGQFQGRVDRVVGIPLLEAGEAHRDVELGGWHRQIVLPGVVLGRLGKLVVGKRGQGIPHAVLVLGRIEGVVTRHLPEHDPAQAPLDDVVELVAHGLFIFGGEEHLLLFVPQPRCLRLVIVVTHVLALHHVSRVVGIQTPGLTVARHGGDTQAGGVLQVLGVPHGHGATADLLAVLVEIVPDVVDADRPVAARNGAATGTRLTIALARQGCLATQTVGATADPLPAAGVVRHAHVDLAGRQGATEVVGRPGRVEVADAAKLALGIDAPVSEFGIRLVVEQGCVVTDEVVPGAVEVVGHQVDVVEVLGDLEVLHAAQQVGRGRRGDGQHVLATILAAGAVELAAQGLHQHLVVGKQLAATLVGEREVVGVTRILHGGGILVVDVDPVKAVLTDEAHRRVGKGVDAVGVDRAVTLGGGGIEAAGIGPAPHRDQGLHVRILLLVLRQQVEVALVGELRIHLGTRYPVPGHLGGRVIHLDGVALLVHRREGVVDVGDLVPGDVAHQVGGQAVLAGTPGGEVADDPAGVVIPHALVAIRAVDLTDIAGEIATGGRQGGLFHLHVDQGRLATQVLLVGRHQLEAGQPLALGRPVHLPGGAGVFTHFLAIDEQLDLGDVVVGIGDVAAHRHVATQGHLGAGGRAADAHLGCLWRHHGGDLEAGIRFAQHLAVFIQRPRLEGVGADTGGTPAAVPGRGTRRGDQGAVDEVLDLDQRRHRAAQGHRQRDAGPFVDTGAGSRRADSYAERRGRHLAAIEFPGIGPDDPDTGLIVIGRGPAPAGVGKFFALIEIADVADDVAGLVGGTGLIGGVGGLCPGGHGSQSHQHGKPAGP